MLKIGSEEIKSPSSSPSFWGSLSGETPRESRAQTATKQKSVACRFAPLETNATKKDTVMRVHSLRVFPVLDCESLAVEIAPVPKRVASKNGHTVFWVWLKTSGPK